MACLENESSSSQVLPDTSPNNSAHLLALFEGLQSHGEMQRGVKVKFEISLAARIDIPTKCLDYE
ncbi:unnamed protein product [Ilex paraguariensis]|uniref:Uncharacterized protein n=1 Tax=Ilex paraguariensis TaxID=185542 RepID=A0ABC8V0U3_9AQUA